MAKPRKAGGGRPSPALLFCALSAALLSSCGSGDDDPGPGGVTVGEARTLDEAAEMLDAQRLPKEALAEKSPVAKPPGTQAAAPAR